VCVLFTGPIAGKSTVTSIGGGGTWRQQHGRGGWRGRVQWCGWRIGFLDEGQYEKLIRFEFKIQVATSNASKQSWRESGLRIWVRVQVEKIFMFSAWNLPEAAVSSRAMVTLVSKLSVTKFPHCAWERVTHHPSTTLSWKSSWADRQISLSCEGSSRAFRGFRTEFRTWKQGDQRTWEMPFLKITFWTPICRRGEEQRHVWWVFTVCSY